MLVDARVLDARGAPLPGLTAGDFVVRVDDRPATVVSATWLPAGGPLPRPTHAIPQGAAAEPARPPRGAVADDPREARRLLVLLFQKDLIPSRARGLLRMTDEARRLVDGLRGADRAAVLSFDSHLRLWADFTGERAALRRALTRGVLFGEGSADAGAAAGEPRLLGRLDPAEARRAASLEKALTLLGEALAPLEGSKSVVLFGWGLGRLGPTGVRMEEDYEPARRALQRARATVFSLDVTDADAHSLEVGLQQVADDTGGFYARTHDFPTQALSRLRGALAGHYVLELERPEGSRGEHRLDVRVVARRATVLARSSYLD